MPVKSVHILDSDHSLVCQDAFEQIDPMSHFLPAYDVVFHMLSIILRFHISFVIKLTHSQIVKILLLYQYFIIYFLWYQNNIFLRICSSWILFIAFARFCTTRKNIYMAIPDVSIVFTYISSISRRFTFPFSQKHLDSRMISK